MSERMKADYKKGIRKPSYSMKGRKHTKETKLKMSLTRLKMAEEGLLMSKKTREKLRNINIGKMCGENHPMWKGGVTTLEVKIRKSTEYRLWRESVFARDNWTCQECGKRGSTTLNAHHIKHFAEYPELRTAIDNGITLCRKCHMKRHRRKK